MPLPLIVNPLKPFLDEGGVLDAGEFGVEAVQREEGVVCAAFDDGAMLKHENLVGYANGAEAVGNHEAGTTRAIS